MVGRYQLVCSSGSQCDQPLCWLPAFIAQNSRVSFTPCSEIARSMNSNPTGLPSHTSGRCSLQWRMTTQTQPKREASCCSHAIILILHRRSGSWERWSHLSKILKVLSCRSWIWNQAFQLSAGLSEVLGLFWTKLLLLEASVSWLHNGEEWWPLSLGSAQARREHTDAVRWLERQFLVPRLDHPALFRRWSPLWPEVSFDLKSLKFSCLPHLCAAVRGWALNFLLPDFWELSKWRWPGSVVRAGWDYK